MIGIKAAGNRPARLPGMGEREVGLLVQSALQRAAEQLGDITPAVARQFAAAMPAGFALFHHHEPLDPARLEGAMVEQALHCLMHWHDSPGEIEIMLISTLPHHVETLGVSHDVFAQYLVTVCAVIAGTIPPDARDEQSAWQRMLDDLLEVIARGASYARPDLARRAG
ncbi:MAG: hypothetical protein ACKOPO_10295 [Novosphingobium sp.]